MGQPRSQRLDRLAHPLRDGGNKADLELEDGHRTCQSNNVSDRMNTSRLLLNTPTSLQSSFAFSTSRSAGSLCLSAARTEIARSTTKAATLCSSAVVSAYSHTSWRAALASAGIKGRRLSMTFLSPFDNRSRYGSAAEGANCRMDSCANN